MTCVICRQGETQPGKATVTLEPGGATIVIRGVPARVCDNCGEEYLDETTTAALLKTADSAAQAGVQVDVRDYVAAQAASRPIVPGNRCALALRS